MPWIYLVLIAVVLVVGIGVVLLNRRRAANERAPGAPTPPAVERPPRPSTPTTSSTATIEAPEVEAEPEPGETEAIGIAPVEPEVLERPTFRSRMGKARSALTGAFLGIRSRAGITDDTWDDLEEALL